MKKFYLFLLGVIVATTVFAQPKLVGHRGSYWGLENSTEAFINGAKKGYHYLETDVKVTKDGVLVCCHNDDLTSWGGTLTIAESNWEDLKAEELSQTRGGVKYTGHLTSFEEYLDICKEYNVLPLIELKWATGINNNDFSNVPKLIEIIEKKGFRNNCFIFTSMKNCLNHIHQNYPDIELMLLIYSESFESSLSWCVERGIHIGSEIGAEITKAGVKMYHDAGLLVDVWSINTNNTYETYGNYGCDFITTDYIDPASLPELDPDVLFPPNIVDYPEIGGVVRGKYEPSLVSMATIPNHLKGMTIRRALLRNDKWYVLAHDANQSPILSVLNSESGEELTRMSLAGIEGGTIALNDIAFTADGELLGCNLAIMQPDNNATWKVYKWSDDNATPQLFYSQSATEMPFEVESSIEVGKSFAVSGKTNDLYLYTMAMVDGVNTFQFIGTKLLNGTVTTTTYAADDANYSVAKWGDDVEIMVTPFSRNNLLIDGKSIAPVQYSFNWDKKGEPLMWHSQWKEGALSNAAEGHSFLRLANKVYAYTANYGEAVEGFDLKIYEVSNGIGEPKAVSPSMGSTTEGNNAYTYTGIEYAQDGTISLYLFSDLEGLKKYEIKGTNVEPSQYSEFVLETVWENSRNNQNAPEHIDGTNAQQGAAYKGKFYVNDCVDKKLYIFDNTGCIGSIPGGSGWGTACDDAGNIIVRDDKNTTGTHKYIIYPSGATVENPGTPIELEVTISLEGQTNFISASGDVLGKGGYIYMYPNQKDQVNIIAIENGQVVEIIQSDKLSMTGSTAGYVIPIDNNSENWIYNVRATGLYRYQGGTNIPVLTGRGSTTAPSRNTTGGGDYFVLSGHEILVHPSGANYRGGFTIRDWEDNSVITSVAPIGDLGYVTGGNYSTFNWLFAEQIDESSYYIYSYCPANGMAMYRFYDKNAGVESVLADKTASLRVYPNPVADEMTVETPDDIRSVAIYNLAGATVMLNQCYVDGNRAKVNVASLPAGIYIVEVNNSIVGKFIKK